MISINNNVNSYWQQAGVFGGQQTSLTNTTQGYTSANTVAPKMDMQSMFKIMFQMIQMLRKMQGQRYGQTQSIFSNVASPYPQMNPADYGKKFLSPSPVTTVPTPATTTTNSTAFLFAMLLSQGGMSSILPSLASITPTPPSTPVTTTPSTAPDLPILTTPVVSTPTTTPTTPVNPTPTHNVQHNLKPENFYKNLFKNTLDANKDGFIDSVKELGINWTMQDVSYNSDPANPDSVVYGLRTGLANADKDGDRKVSLVEYNNWIKENANKDGWVNTAKPLKNFSQVDVTREFGNDGSVTEYTKWGEFRIICKTLLTKVRFYGIILLMQAKGVL
jgi:hypothetical protein